MAATMAAGMTPPLAIALATRLFANRYTAEEREAGGATGILGLAFITEGAIPFVARDPLRMIPSLMAGSAVTGAISMAIGAELKVPHGGIFVLPIPGAVTHLLGYVAALIAGTLVSALAIGLLKRPLAARNRNKGCATAVATRVRPAWQHVSSGSAQQWKSPDERGFSHQDREAEPQRGPAGVQPFSG